MTQNEFARKPNTVKISSLENWVQNSCVAGDVLRVFRGKDGMALERERDKETYVIFYDLKCNPEFFE